MNIDIGDIIIDIGDIDIDFGDINIDIEDIIIDIGDRVAKCQGYWGYIRVKMFAGWGKKFGRTCNFAKSSLFGKIYASFSSFPCTN